MTIIGIHHEEKFVTQLQKIYTTYLPGKEWLKVRFVVRLVIVLLKLSVDCDEILKSVNESLQDLVVQLASNTTFDIVCEYLEGCLSTLRSCSSYSINIVTDWLILSCLPWLKTFEADVHEVWIVVSGNLSPQLLTQRETEFGKLLMKFPFGVYKS